MKDLIKAIIDYEQMQFSMTDLQRADALSEIFKMAHELEEQL